MRESKYYNVYNSKDMKFFKIQKKSDNKNKTLFKKFERSKYKIPLIKFYS